MKPSILIISSFPPKGQTHNKKIVGVASYTRNLLRSIPGRKVVLAEILPGEKNYKEDSIEVRRVWKRNSIFAFFSLFKAILKDKESSTILFEFEHAMFGGPLSLIPLPFFLFITNKVWGKKVIFVFHQVIGNINELAGHLNLKKRSLKSCILNLLIPAFYKLALMNVTKAIVFEESLKERLAKFDDPLKIEVIPHGVEVFDSKLASQGDPLLRTRRQLGLPNDKFILLCFGFLAWYKGSDLIIKMFAKLPKRIKENSLLILGGGPNPNYANKSFYNEYIERLKEEAQKNGILVTGFIPEEKIPLYFKASDVVLLPYRTFMSASGPMSMALSFEKPFLISSVLSPLVKTQDFKSALEKSNLSKNDLIFNLNGKSLENKIRSLKTGNLRQNLVKFSKVLKGERYFKKIAVNYERILFQGSDEIAQELYPGFEPELV